MNNKKEICYEQKKKISTKKGGSILDPFLKEREYFMLCKQQHQKQQQ
jgi:hypothetical protein